MLNSQKITPIPGARYCKIHAGTKRPMGNEWQDKPFKFHEIQDSVESLDYGSCGWGIVYGDWFVGFDVDNAEGRERFKEYFGCCPADYPSVSWSSGKTFNGEWQSIVDDNTCLTVLFKVTPEQSRKLSGRRVFKNNSLDLRTGKTQSVLPSNKKHPETRKPWRWVNSPNDSEVILLNDSILEQILEDISEDNSKDNRKSQSSKKSSSKKHSDKDSSETKVSNSSNADEVKLAQECLKYISCDDFDTYDDWLMIGMALHATDDNLLHDWIDWSSQSSKFSPGECEYKWKSFNRTGYSLGTLIYHAKEYGLEFQGSFSEVEKRWVKDSHLKSLPPHYNVNRFYNRFVSDSNLFKLFRQALPFEINNEGRMNGKNFEAIVSPTGTGKTALIKDISLLYDKGVVLVVPNKALAKQASFSFGFENYEKYTDKKQLRRCKNIVICINSLHKLISDGTRDKLLVFDEASMIKKNCLTSSTMREQRGTFGTTLQKAISSASTTLLIDADMTEATLEWFFQYQYCLTDKQPRVHINQYKNTTRTAELFNYYKDSGEPSSSYEEYIDIFIKEVLNGKYIAVPCDTKSAVKAIKELATQSGLKSERIFILHGDNSSDDDVKEQVTKINDGWCKKDESDQGKIFVYSPSASTGLDINNHDFDAVYALLTGDSITVKESVQLFERVRGMSHINIFCKPTYRTERDTDYNKILAQLEQNYAEVGINIGRIDPNIGKRICHDPWVIDSYIYEKINEHEQLNSYDEGLRQWLEVKGYTYSEQFFSYTGNKKEDISKAREQIKYNEREAVINSRELDYSDVCDLNNKIDPNSDDRSALSKYYMKKFFEVEELDHNLIKADEEGKTRQGLRLLNCLEDGEEYAEFADLKELKESSETASYELTNRIGKVKALNKTELIALIHGGCEWTKDSALVQRICENALAISDDLERLFGLKLKSNEEPCRIIGGLLDLVGLRAVAEQRRDSDGERKRYYSICPYRLSLWERVRLKLKRRNYFHGTNVLLEGVTSETSEEEIKTRFSRATTPTTITGKPQWGAVTAPHYVTYKQKNHPVGEDFMLSHTRGGIIEGSGVTAYAAEAITNMFGGGFEEMKAKLEQVDTKDKEPTLACSLEHSVALNREDGMRGIEHHVKAVLSCIFKPRHVKFLKQLYGTNIVERIQAEKMEGKESIAEQVIYNICPTQVGLVPQKC